MCVCVCERERERDEVKLDDERAKVWEARLEVSVCTRDRARERGRERRLGGSMSVVKSGRLTCRCV